MEQKTLFNIDTLLPHIDSGTLILTPNRRLSAKINAAYEQAQCAAGKTVWPTPRVQPIDSWLQQHWQLANIGDASLLSDIIELSIWEKIIKKSEHGRALLQPEQAAHKAMQAYKLSQLWQLPNPDLNALSNLDHIAFAHWLTEFESYCTKNQLINFSQVPKILVDNPTPIEKQNQVVLVHFHELAPIRKVLLDGLFSNVTYDYSQQQNSQQQSSHISCTTLEEEILTAAHWAKSALADTTDLSIGIISPELREQRQLFQRIFTEVFEEHYAHPETKAYTLPFNFSAGTALIECPVIDSALSLLALNQYKIKLDSCIEILHSPFQQFDSLNFEEKNILENKLRKLQIENIQNSDFRALIHRSINNEDFTSNIQTAAEISRQNKQKQTPSLWVSVLLEQLSTLGWPGTRVLNSEEYQQVSLFYNWLNELHEFDAVSPSISYFDFQKLIRKNLHQVVFQAETKDSPIQILGLLEGSGLHFDAIWVTGLDDHSWPPSPEPNPFIPYHYQKENQLPRSDIERETLYAKKITESYQQSGKAVIFSHAKTKGELPLKCSALLNDITETSLKKLKLKHLEKNTRICIDKTKQELFFDSNGPALSEAEKVGGGAGLLKRQAQCPFQAFATHRLALQAPDQPALGLSSIDRGQLVHYCLEYIWKELTDQQALLALTEEQKTELIYTHIQRAIKSLTSNKKLPLGLNFWSIETERLYKLIDTWLTIESQRPEFSVYRCEESIEISIKEIPLKLRIDRIDTLANGTTLLIDYKTGSPTPNDWGSNRPKEPQLPLYAIAYQSAVKANDEGSEQPVGAISFAQVNIKSSKYLGLASEEIDKNIKSIEKNRAGLPKNWPETLQHWDTSLNTLAEQFKGGIATVDPKSSNACVFCQLQPVCRIYEKTDMADEQNNHSNQEVITQ